MTKDEKDKKRLYEKAFNKMLDMTMISQNQEIDGDEIWTPCGQDFQKNQSECPNN